MSIGPRFTAFLLALLLTFGLAPRVQAGAYEAELPANLATAPDMCALLPCAEVFPGAVRFSQRKGQPPYVEAYGQEGNEATGCWATSCCPPTSPTRPPTRASRWSR